MGAWGTGLFSDDTASDIRDSYREHLGNRLSGPEATARVLFEFAPSLADPSEAGVVWLALAASQWNVGRLEPETLDRALAVIESGSDLARWNTNPSDRRKRQLILEKLRDQLQSPQAAEKKVPKRHKETCDWDPGNLLAYRLLSGKLMILRVVSLHTDKGGTSPVCELIDWIGTEIPSESALSVLPVRQSSPSLRYQVHKLVLFRKKKANDARLQLLDFNLPPGQTKRGAAAVHWKNFDASMKKWFELE